MYSAEKYFSKSRHSDIVNSMTGAHRSPKSQSVLIELRRYETEDFYLTLSTCRHMKVSQNLHSDKYKMVNVV